MINSFNIEIQELINSNYSDIIEHGKGGPYPILLLPNKGVAFHIINTPKTDNGLNNEHLFADLSDNYSLQSIRLIHLWEDLWVQKRTIIESRIKLILGDFTRIHARQTKVQRIDKPTIDVFLNENHLYGSPLTKYKYGLYLKEQLVAVASFSAMRTYWRNNIAYRSSELVRFANINGYAVAGGLSKLLAYFVREQQPDDVMSYADRDWSNGESYEKLRFSKIENTPPQMFWLHPDEQIRYYPHRLPNRLLIGLQQQNSALFVDDYFIQNGYLRIFNAGNIKYILNLKE